MGLPARVPRRVVLTAPDEICPFCGIRLRISQHRDRAIRTIPEDLSLTMRDKKCPSPTCPQPHLRYRSPEEPLIAFPHDMLGLDVVLEVGYLRFHQHLGFPRIHAALKERGLAISEMGVQYQSRKYEALVACRVTASQNAMIEKLAARGFLLPIIDAVHYGSGEAVVYLIIDGLSGMPLFGQETVVRGKIELVPFIRQLTTLGLPIIGVVSDKESGLAPAIAEALPGVPHQFCQRHYLGNVAKPMEQDLAALGEDVRKREEKLREFQRDLIRLEAKAKADGKPVPEDLPTALEFCEAARAAARIHGRPITDPSPLKRHQGLKRVEKAVARAGRKKGGHWRLLKRLQTIIQPSSQACRWASRLTMCMIVLIGIRNILWPKKAPKGGDLVKKRLSSFLDNQLALAPPRGLGAYLRRFVEHAWKVTESYWPGLFHCYDDPRIPRTSNRIEGVFGKGKRILRACGGRKSTAVGPGSTGGSFFLFTVAFHDLATRQEREDLLKQYSRQEYEAARARQRVIRDPEVRWRRFVRNPDAVLDSIGQRWEARTN